ncbi:MAG: hypothetical protein OEL53_08120 [Rhodospirillales bacterium]|nr:hypothetical protein [Rhodospirillales bacterium]
MIVAINVRPVSGPWGGGNNFVKALIDALEARGDTVVFDLSGSRIDIILIVDPRPRNPARSFSPGAALRRKDALVVHRINECDERKGGKGMNARLRLANLAADHTVFIASWLQKLAVWRRQGPCSVILNGADSRVFHDHGKDDWNGQEPLRLVTHHWGAHAFKGFDVYAHIDSLLDIPAWRQRLSFTYIGNMPQDFRSRNICHLPALDARALADELRRHHVYITASINEPAGMHHIEGALCGLPVLYRTSGALPEYCAEFGEPFSGPGDVDQALERICASYLLLRQRLPETARTAKQMCAEYLALFDAMIKERETIVAARKRWHHPLDWLLNQMAFL